MALQVGVAKENIRENKVQTVKNSEYIKQAFELLSQIIDDTEKADKNLIGFKAK